MEKTLQSQIREKILVLVRLPALPGDTGVMANQEPDLDVLKYDAIDSACAVLQGDTGVDIPAARTHQNAAFQSILDQIPSSSLLHVKLTELLAHIDALLQMSGKLESEYVLRPETIPDFSEAGYQEVNQRIFVANGKLEAESIRFFLNSFGIQALVEQESVGVTLGLTVGSLGEADVIVTDADKADAAALLEAMKEGLFIFPEDEEIEIGDDAEQPEE